MKIAFITGCLEPGRDGVGDCVRRLAAECVRQGHTVALVSLAERPDDLARSSEESLPVRRATLDRCRADGGAELQRWLSSFAPDWTSLHFVPYSFNPRGFFGPMIPMLARLSHAAPNRQIYFHEIWIGFAHDATWRQRLTGWWQRRSVGQLLRALSPAVIHTSVGYYSAGLRTLGYSAKPLPMVGIVPWRGPADNDGAIPEIDPAALVCGMFGALHPNWQSEPFLSDFVSLAASLRRPAVLASVGDLRAGASFFSRIAVESAPRLNAIAFGHRSQSGLAGIFSRFDFGVSSVPWTLIGKSSSAAALREHGLQVVITNSGALPRFALQPADTERDDAGFLPYFRDRGIMRSVPARTTPRAGAEALARTFLRDLGD